MLPLVGIFEMALIVYMLKAIAISAIPGLLLTLAIHQLTGLSSGWSGGIGSAIALNAYFLISKRPELRGHNGVAPLE